MSQRHKVQDATGVIVTTDADVIMFIIQTTTPTDGKAGYGPGCLWINKNGTSGSVVYANRGTVTSTTWYNIA